jgi:WD40 repeat protein
MITGQIATASKDGTVKVWQPFGRSFSKRRLRVEEAAYIEFARFSPDGRTLVETSNWSGNVVRHDLARRTHKKWRVFHWVAGRVAWAQNAQRFALSGKEVLAGDVTLAEDVGVDQDCAVVVCDAQTMRIEHRIQAYSGEATCAAISPDGGHLAVAETDHTIRIWELPSRRLLHTVPGESVPVLDIVYSPDGRFLLAAVGDDLRVWNSQDFTLKHDFKQHDNTIARVVVSDDSRLAATVSHDKSVRLWSLNEGRHLRALTGHTTIPTAAAFSKDGRCLATGADGATVHIWDVVTGQQLIDLNDAANKASFIRDLIFWDERTLIAAVKTDEPPEFFLAKWRLKWGTDASE